MKNRSFLFQLGVSFFILCLWFMLSFLVGNDLFLPSPLQVFTKMGKQVQDKEFVLNYLTTLYRLGLALGLAIIMSLILVFLSKLSVIINEIIIQLLLVVRIVPTAAFILISLLWLGRDKSVLLISMLVMVPLIYDTLCHKFNEIQIRYKDPIRLYGGSLIENIMSIYLPLSIGSWLSIIRSSILIGLKVIVTSEVIVSIQQGLGKDMSIASRIDLDSVRLFADTIWILLIAIITSKIFNYLIKKTTIHDIE